MTLKATKKQFEAELARHPGAALDLETADYDLFIDAPPGFVWQGDGVHTLCEPWRNEGGQSWKPEAYAAAIDRMRDGLTLCSTPDCDVCADRRGG